MARARAASKVGASASRSLGQHEQRDSDEAAHMDAIVLQQLLAGRIVPQTTRQRSPEHDRQPRQ